MTRKIARFLADHQPATPCLVFDVDRAEENFRTLQRALPVARIYYAVKANPAAPVLERLAGLGSFFDAASIEEIEACLAAGAGASAVSFGNTIKKASAIARAHAHGVGMYAFDSAEELKKAALSGSKAEYGTRLGELLFSAVGAAGLLGVEAEQSLSDSCEHYIARFEAEELKKAETADSENID